MLLPVTVLEGGKTKRTVVRAMYARETLSISIGYAARVGIELTISTNHPTELGSFHFLSGRARRPCKQLTRMGMAYERSRATTAAAMIALNALYTVSQMSIAVLERNGVTWKTPGRCSQK
jgi:hypothetical protein